MPYVEARRYSGGVLPHLGRGEDGEQMSRVLVEVVDEGEALVRADGVAHERVEDRGGVLARLEEEFGHEGDEIAEEARAVGLADERRLERGVGLGLVLAEHYVSHLAQVLRAALLALLVGEEGGVGGAGGA